MICCKSCFSLKGPGTWPEFDDLDSSVSHFINETIAWNSETSKQNSNLSLKQLDPHKFRASIDCEGEEALAAFFDIIDDPEMYKEFDFQAGQIQFVNNRLIGHKRTGFEDWSDENRKRHLLRVWLRESGRVFYNG